MSVGHYPSDEPERDDEELRDPREIIRDIIGSVSQPSSASPHNVGL